MVGDAPKRHPRRHSTPSNDSTICSGTATFTVSLPRTAMCATNQGGKAVGCYDKANHAAHLKKYKGSEYSGDKRSFALYIKANAGNGVELRQDG
jgi:hypothetical protein